MARWQNERWYRWTEVSQGSLSLPFPRINQKYSWFVSRGQGQGRTGLVAVGHFVKPGRDPFCAKSAVMGLSACMLNTRVSLGIPLKGSKWHSIDSAPPFPAQIPAPTKPSRNPKNYSNIPGEKKKGEEGNSKLQRWQHKTKQKHRFLRKKTVVKSSVSPQSKGPWGYRVSHGGVLAKPGLDPFCAKSAVMGLSVCILSTGMSLGIPLKGSKWHSAGSSPHFQPLYRPSPKP